MRRIGLGLAIAAIVAAAAIPLVGAEAHRAPAQGSDKLLLFAADGLRQDAVEKYAGQGAVPGFRELLRHGAQASGNGLLTQAPPNTGAGWFTLATGAWPGVTGSTNNTFHINGQPFANRTAAFDAGVLQAETLAQAAERGGKKVAQIEWAGGRSAAIDGPTLDFRNFRSGPRRGDQLHRAGRHRRRSPPSFGLQFDHPAGFAGQRAVRRGRAGAGDRLDRRARARTARPRRCACACSTAGVDKYGLNAYIYDSRDDGTDALRPRAVLADQGRRRRRRRTCARASGPTSRSRSRAATSTARPARCSSRSSASRSDLSQVRLFHTSVTRAIATWPNWPGEPGFTGNFEDFVAERFPSSQAGDFAVLEAGIVSEETYVEQGLYWETAYHPLIKYVLDKYQPDLALVGYPVTDEFQHQFLGLVTPTAARTARRNPAYDDVEVNGTPDGRVAAARGVHPPAPTRAPTRPCGWPSSACATDDLTTFVSSDHGFAPQFAAIDASKVLVDLGLLSTPQTVELPPGDRRDDRQGQGLLGRRHGADLPQPRRAAIRRGGGFQQVAGRRRGGDGRTRSRPRSLALEDPNDWTGDGQPEGWKVIDRVFTKAEARYIPNGAGSTADMAHPTRTGDLVVFSYPPYQFDAATPGTLIARSAFFGQHGYVPDVQDLHEQHEHAGDVPRRRAGDRPRQGRATCAASTSRRRRRSCSASRRRSRARASCGATCCRRGDRYTPLSIIGLNDFHGQLDPTTTTIDGRHRDASAARRSWRRCSTRRPPRCPARRCCWRPATTSARRRRTRRCSRTCRRSTSRTPGGSTPRLRQPRVRLRRRAHARAHRRGPNFPFLSANIVEEATGETPDWVDASTVFRVNGVRVGVIGATVRTTPELVSRRRHRGAVVPRRGRADRGASRAGSGGSGVRVQVVVIHEGAARGANAIDGLPAAPWEGPIIGIVEALQDTTIDLVDRRPHAPRRQHRRRRHPRRRGRQRRRAATRSRS